MTNNKQQTAVDLAFEKLANQGLLVTKDYKNLVAYREAKEMEKEQIKQSWVSAWQDSMINPKEYRFYKPDTEQYYDETFNTKEK